MAYKDAIDILQGYRSLGIQPGLSRISHMLHKMGNPQDKIKTIHVAGTNGKGTVCSMIADALGQNGFKVGLFTSPWITDYREQIQINNHFISEEDFAFYVEKYGDGKVTEFELIAAIAFQYFADEAVDYAIIECGMGGAGDATNVIKSPKLAVITSISFDHTDFLGKTLEKIANEKSGIIKQGTKVVLYPNRVVEHVFQEKCHREKAALYTVQETGNFMQNNLATAHKALDLLGINTQISLPNLPARMEWIKNNILLDGSHNTDGAAALVSCLPQNKKVIAVIAMMCDKDIEGYLSVLAPRCSRIIATAIPDNPRVMNSEELCLIANEYCDCVSFEDNPQKAIEMAEKTRGDNMLLICGSLYLARALRKDLL